MASWIVTQTFNNLVSNVYYQIFIKYRGVFTTQSNIYDGAFMQK